MDSVITYDLQNYKLDFNEEFDMETFLKDSQLGQIERVVDKKLQDFTRQLGASVKYSLQQETVTGSFEEFLSQVLLMMKLKERLNVVYE